MLSSSVPTAVSHSYAKREHREHVAPGSGFFGSGVLVIHPAPKAANHSGKGENRKSPTQI